MCSPTRCRVCSKTTWTGCGQHVAMVRASVPKADWCGSKHTEAEILAARPTGFFSRLFG